ncbi:TetR family transcriptional regulator [Acetobacterium tundrae]|uniref:TetR family transcriptional regulator n=1 Tax=Acetobacterium tundrae TaxID=132932 RepID=A0ABR6WMA8_9FIRM|nr:TetR family transcriptional regulator [Acetobacterium tundrae]MBC3797619.1 TetR family transcriptional regulator [Acetobacterium tundrae]
MESFELNEEQTSREKLLTAGVYLFARFGYKGTSTRMIAETTNLNIATMHFHFKNKENFYKNVIAHVEDQIKSRYSNFTQKIDDLKSEPVLAKDLIWQLICEFIDLQLDITFDETESDIFLLLSREQLYDFDELPLTQIIFEKAENSLTFLLTHYYDTLPIEKAIVLSRLINGALVSYGDHATFLSTSPVSHSLSKSFIKDSTRDFVLNAIANYPTEKAVFVASF